MNIIDTLNTVLASNYVLYTKTQHFHWNVAGMHFVSLHTLFEEQYTNLAEGNDVLAEQIRSLDAFAPGTMAQFLELSVLKEQTGVPSATEMLKELIEDHTTMISTLKKAIEDAEEAKEPGVADLLTERLRWHEKTLWMLKIHV